MAADLFMNEWMNERVIVSLRRERGRRAFSLEIYFRPLLIDGRVEIERLKVTRNH